MKSGRNRGRPGAAADDTTSHAPWPQNVPDIVLAALQRVGKHSPDASAAGRLVLNERALHSRQRSKAADLLFDLARLSGRLDGRVRHALGGQKLEPLDRDRWRLAALLTAEQGEPADQVATQLKLPPDRVAALPGESYLDGLAGADRLAMRHSMPGWLCQLLLEDGMVQDVDALLGALNERAPLFVRAANSQAALLAELAEAGVPAQATRWSTLGVELLRHVNVRGLPAFQSGRMEVQDLGSQLIAQCVAPQAGEHVVDACAGAGGKALALAALEPACRVTAIEPVKDRLDALQERSRRAHVRIRPVQAGAGEEATRPLWGTADAVLVDAPCSGVGAMRREPASRWLYNRAQVEGFHDTQVRVASLCVHLLKPGGRLIYATCSLTKRENEDVVAALLASHPRLSPIPLASLLGDTTAKELGAVGHQLRLMPHLHNSDGFFMAALRLDVGA